MTDAAPLIKRDLYLNRLISFQDTEPVKIITGIRRSGKSKLLDLMIQHLQQSGIANEQILKMNFESFKYENMDKDTFHSYVLSKCIAGKKMYFFFDEPHKITGWETVVNSFRVDVDCDIYITGSNAHMLSSEYATYLSGRFIEIKIYPLSFSEFITFRGLSQTTVKTPLGTEQKYLVDSAGNRYLPAEIFELYLKFGGMPGLSHLPLNSETVNIILDGIFTSVVSNDILQRDRWSGDTKIRDPVLLKKIAVYLADNIGKETSSNNLTNTLRSANQSKENRNYSSHTVTSYINAFVQSYLFYEAKRFDIRGKELLKTLSKYYIADIGFRNYLLGYNEVNRGYALENIVYFELLRRGYDVSVGKIASREVDFRACGPAGSLYIQVTESLASPETLEREFAPLKMIKDNYEKIILTTDAGDREYDGIKVVNIINWLLE